MVEVACSCEYSHGDDSLFRLAIMNQSPKALNVIGARRLLFAEICQSGVIDEQFVIRMIWVAKHLDQVDTPLGITLAYDRTAMQFRVDNIAR